MHIFRLEPLLPEGITLRDLADDREAAGTADQDEPSHAG